MLAKVNLFSMIYTHIHLQTFYRHQTDTRLYNNLCDKYICPTIPNMSCCDGLRHKFPCQGYDIMRDPMTIESIIVCCFTQKFNHHMCNLSIYVYITALHRSYPAHCVMGTYCIVFTLLIWSHIIQTRITTDIKELCLLFVGFLLHSIFY